MHARGESPPSPGQGPRGVGFREGNTANPKTVQDLQPETQEETEPGNAVGP